MDNQQNNSQPQGGENGNQGNNGKFPKNQLLIVLIAAFITFAIAGFMRGYMTDKSQKKQKSCDKSRPDEPLPV